MTKGMPCLGSYFLLFANCVQDIFVLKTVPYICHICKLQLADILLVI
jgi:hypothetical protein